MDHTDQPELDLLDLAGPEIDPSTYPDEDSVTSRNQDFLDFLIWRSAWWAKLSIYTVVTTVTGWAINPVIHSILT